MEKENRTNIKVEKAHILLHTHKALHLSLDIWQFECFLWSLKFWMQIKAFTGGKENKNQHKKRKDPELPALRIIGKNRTTNPRYS